MSKLSAPLPDEPIFHHAEPKFAHKLNQLMDAVREIQDHLNADAAEPAKEKPLTAAQKKKLAEEEAARKEAENAGQKDAGDQSS